MNFPLPANLQQPNQPDVFSFGFTRLLNRGQDEIESPVVYDNNERLSVMAQGTTVTSTVPGLGESIVDL